jgi:hypothetical protein
MPPYCHPCIDISEHEFLGGLAHHHVEERTNTKKGITKKMPCCNIGRIGWKSRYAKPIGCQFETHMGYDGKNENVVN